MQLDSYLVESGLVETRSRAAALIKEKGVSVDGEIITKRTYDVEGKKVEVLQKVYVSRAALKLLSFLESEELDVVGMKALDIGSSTGGFSEVLLEKGISSVTCVDVGRDQLHPKIRDDSRVRVYESTDFRAFDVQDSFDLIVSDVSFISLHLLLDKIDTFSKGEIILLFKPQFEVGKEAKRDKKGVVLDKKAIEEAMERFESRTQELKWDLVRKKMSSLKGKEGNQEWVYRFHKRT